MPLPALSPPTGLPGISSCHTNSLTPGQFGHFDTFHCASLDRVQRVSWRNVPLTSMSIVLYGLPLELFWRTLDALLYFPLILANAKLALSPLH